MSFNEEDRVEARLRGHGWRSLARAQMVRCYLASTWIETPVTDVNDETRYVRIAHPVATRGIRHFILDASQYRPTEGLFGHE
jgi:hypothetical protein